MMINASSYPHKELKIREQKSKSCLSVGTQSLLDVT